MSIVEAKAIGKTGQEKLPTEEYNVIFVETVATDFHPKGSTQFLKIPPFFAFSMYCFVCVFLLVGSENRKNDYGLLKVSPDSRSSMVPTQGSYNRLNSSGLLIVRIAAKARMRVSGKASANRFAAARRVAPRVTISSIRTISSGLERIPVALIDL